MEIWDGYTADKQLAGVDLVREEEFTSDSFPKGLDHLVSDVVVRHTDGTWLAMQRDFNKAGHPGEWELGAGGSVLKGETAYEGALRELAEETGVRTDDLTLVSEVSCIHSNGVGVHYSVYLCVTDMDKDAVTLQEGETIDYKWVTTEEVISGSYIPERRVDVVKKISED